MPMNVRNVGDVTILSNFGRLLNDPRHFDAGRDLHDLLDEGRRKFVLDLATLREVGDTALALLVSLTRQVRQSGGEVVLTNVRPTTERFLEEMRVDDYWDIFASIEEAREFFGEEETETE